MCTNGKIIPIKATGEDFRRPIRTNCGNCIECFTTRANAWAYRNYSQYLRSDNAYFITLTLNDENLSEAPNKQDIQLFNKRLRSFLAYHYPDYDVKLLKFFLVSEYGYNTERLHYHAIYYNLPYTAGTPYVQISNEFARIWGKGICYVKPFQLEQIYYCIKYLHKDKELGNIRMNSTNLGFISAEMVKYMNTTTNYENIKVKIGYGKTIAMPRYFRKKYMTEDQKKQFGDFFIQKNEKMIKDGSINLKKYNFDRRNQKFMKS